MGGCIRMQVVLVLPVLQGQSFNNCKYEVQTFLHFILNLIKIGMLYLSKSVPR